MPSRCRCSVEKTSHGQSHFWPSYAVGTIHGKMGRLGDTCRLGVSVSRAAGGRTALHLRNDAGPGEASRPVARLMDEAVEVAEGGPWWPPTL